MSINDDDVVDSNSDENMQVIFDELIENIDGKYQSDLAKLYELYKNIEELNEDNPNPEYQSISTQIESWIQIDLAQYFNPKITLRKNENRLLDFFNDLPGFLVFLPITWTWWCLSKARSEEHTSELQSH